jgi:carbon-monoxide dehydrogenase medium subunit
VKPAAFRYALARSIDECVALLAEHGEDAKVLAGGQSLVALMNLRLARPEVLVDINQVRELSHVTLEGDVLRLGATTRHREIAASDVVARACPPLSQAAAMIGYPAIRNRGTIGGSIAHADPVAEIPCVACATDAEIVAVGPGGRRTIAARDFFLGYFTTALDPSELLVEIRFPVIGPGDAWDVREFTRKSGDFAVALVAVGITVDDGAVARVRIAFGGGSDRPLRATEAEQMLAGAGLDDGQLARASAGVLAAARHAESDSARHAGSDPEESSVAEVVGALAGRALHTAALRSRGAS